MPEIINILVVTSCTGEKKHKVPDQLIQKDFRDPKRLASRTKDLSHHLCPAEEMYTGQQHLRLMEGVKLLREAGVGVDLLIVSAGYGLILGDRKIAPYECTFDSMGASEIDAWSDFLKIPQDFRSHLTACSLCIVLLGKKYLRSIMIKNGEQFPVPVIFFCANKKEIRGSSGVVYPAGIKEAKDFSCGLVGLKGEIFRVLAQQLAREPNLIERLKQEPESVALLLNAQRKGSIGLGSETEHSRVNKLPPKNRRLSDICPPDLREGEPANYYPPTRSLIPYTPRKSATMLYFIPDWDDLVDPRYDFQNDFHCSERFGIKHDSYYDDVYAHELMGRYNYDGILVSRVTIEESKQKKSRVERDGIHAYLRCPDSFPVMGDCGAFGYSSENKPPYNTHDIINYYDRLGFNFGVSIDHLIFPQVCQKTTYYEELRKGDYKEIDKCRFEKLKADQRFRLEKSRPQSRDFFDSRRVIYSRSEFNPREAQRRWNITLKNGRDFIQLYRRRAHGFHPIGACQGWDADSYVEMFKAYQKIGYDYIALGGLVRSPTKEILDILEKIARVRKPGVKIHLFGIARLDAVADFLRLGIASCDSASHLRRAWLGATQNYWATAEETYAAIRVPPVDGHSVKVGKMLREEKGTLGDFKRLEAKSLQALRDFDQGKISIEPALKIILAYDRLIGEDRENLEQFYRRTLESAPWKKCLCPVCQEQGIETLIFRRNNRNRRRGFHNTYIYFQEFKQLTTGRQGSV